MRAVYALAGLLASAGCAPSKFSELRAGRDAGLRSPDGAPGALDDSSVDEQPVPGEPDEASVDGGQDAGLPEEPSDAGCPEPPNGSRKLVFAGPPVELARLSNPVRVGTRSLSATAWLGNSRIWMFASTVPKASADAAPFVSAALDGLPKPWLYDTPSTRPWTLGEELDADGLPLPFLSVTPGEAARFVSLTVPSVIRRSDQDTGGLAFVRKAVGLGSASEVWLADIDDGSTVGHYRDGPLFSGDDPKFSLGAYQGGKYVKVFACERVAGATESDLPTFPCFEARVPLAQVGERAAYEVRTAAVDDAGAWSKDFAKAAPVLYGHETDLSVSWNAHLGRALAVHSAFFSNKVVFHTAPSTDGPWTFAGELELPAPPVWTVMSAREQPGLVQRCGRRLILSHWAPTAVDQASGFPSAGDVVLSAVDLE
jgi:hypothetical protein